MYLYKDLRYSRQWKRQNYIVFKLIDQNLFLDYRSLVKEEGTKIIPYKTCKYGSVFKTLVK